MVIIANIFLILGVITLLISSIGIIRLPSFFTRIHPVAKSTTLGIILFFAGVAILEPSWAPRLIVAVILFMFTGPVSASALGRSAIPKDKLEEFYPKEESND
ncbi:MAG: monovalent cation/H(+) antiporter subunit G [Spirochaetales bacterium]|nr:monovalent cation/H(+) antiporter subunit G [Spirochaetales bacterium]